MDEIKKTKGKQIKEARTKRAAREGVLGVDGQKIVFQLNFILLL